MRLPCTGVVLAGGAAARYAGRPKGLERVGGQRIIDRVTAVLSSAADDLLLVANDPAASGWLPGVRLASDVLTGEGSLGGIHAAIIHANGPALVVAWDMPFVPAGLLTRLRELGEEADVVVPESGSRRGVEPLCAWYGPRCIPAIERSIASGDRRVIGFFDAVRVARLPSDAVAAFGDLEWMFMNVNSPDDLVRAEAYAATADAGDHRP
jgi:molybdopterin-guanine dinucleotide biosynthesis protein A